jgi:hypothetical protein
MISINSISETQQGYDTRQVKNVKPLLHKVQHVFQTFAMRLKNWENEVDILTRAKNVDINPCFLSSFYKLISNSVACLKVIFAAKC